MLTHKQKRRRWWYKALSLAAFGLLFLAGGLWAALEGLNTTLKRREEAREPYRIQSAREETFLKTLRPGDLFTISYGVAENRRSDCLRFAGYSRPTGSTLLELKASYLAEDAPFLLAGRTHTAFAVGCAPEQRQATLEAETKRGSKVAAKK